MIDGHERIKSITLMIISIRGFNVRASACCFVSIIQSIVIKVPPCHPNSGKNGILMDTTFNIKRSRQNMEHRIKSQTSTPKLTHIQNYWRRSTYSRGRGGLFTFVMYSLIYNLLDRVCIIFIIYLFLWRRSTVYHFVALLGRCVCVWM